MLLICKISCSRFLYQWNVPVERATKSVLARLGHCVAVKSREISPVPWVAFAKTFLWLVPLIPHALSRQNLVPHVWLRYGFTPGGGIGVIFCPPPEFAVELASPRPIPTPAAAAATATSVVFCVFQNRVADCTFV